MNYRLWDFASDTEKDIRANFGDNAISKVKDTNWKYWINLYDSMTPEEQDLISVLKNDRIALAKLVKSVQERVAQ